MLQSKRPALVTAVSVAVGLILLGSYYWAYQPPPAVAPPPTQPLAVLGATSVPTSPPITTPRPGVPATGEPVAAPPTDVVDPPTAPPAPTETPRPTPPPERGPDGRYLGLDEDTPQAIPDDNPVGALARIIVPESFTITAVQLLNLRVQHPDTSELIVALRAPDGTTIAPLKGICPGAKNWKALSLLDGLPRTVGEGCQDDLDDGFRPPAGQELARFRGHPAQGTWTIQVVDNRPGNTGTLVGWSLLFTDTVATPVAPPAPPANTPDSPAPPTAPPDVPAPPLVERGPDGRYLSTDLNAPRAIPDNSATGVVSHILVPDKFTVRAVQLLNLRAQHPNTGDLVVTLRAPDGTTITPVKGICPGAKNWKALSLADGLARTVGDGCQNNLDDGFHPPAGQELARFRGHPAQGDWTLKVVDTRAGNSGTLLGWSLLFTTTLPSPATATPAAKTTPGGSAPGPLVSERGPDGRYLSADLDTPRAIPDNSAAGVVSHVIVPEKFNVTAVQLLNLRAQHPNTGDLVVTLRAPDGTTITPLKGICPGAKNWKALSLADGFAQALGTGCQDDLDDGFHPPAGQELARFRGHPAQGDWTLKVVDTRPGNSGSLVGWSLLFTTTLPSPATATPAGAPPGAEETPGSSAPAATDTPGPLVSERGPDGRYLSADLDDPVAIPDNNAAGIISHVIVPESFNVAFVQLLNLRVQHPDTGDLVVTLRAPDGTTITPIQGMCPGAKNWKALSLADGFARPVGDGCQDDLDDGFHPPAGQELARFRGHPAQGDWTLKVVDTRPGNSGSLVGWSLLFTDTDPTPPTATPEGGSAPEETPPAAPPSDRGDDGRYISADLDPARAIPDNDPAGAISRITVPEQFVVGSVQLLNLRVQHPDTGDLVVRLRAPDGTTITPIRGICPGAQNWHALSLDDSYLRTVGENCADDLDDGFRPMAGEELAHFAGLQAQGTWTIQVVDTRPGNSGSLVGWSLLFTVGTPKQITPPAPSGGGGLLLPVSSVPAAPVTALMGPVAALFDPRRTLSS